MGTWKINQVGDKPDLHNPILIEGLPGIGNVGKVAVDFMIDALGAKKLLEFSSYYLPHSVFVNEDNLIELPTIELYYKKLGNGKSDLLLLAGDVQPIEEASCYEFSDIVLDLCKKFNADQVITLGGIGLQNVPQNPTVYCTGNSKKLITSYAKGSNIDVNLYGVVGPIIGVSGLLLGLASRRNIEAISFLAETYGHPMYLGVKGAREILKILNTKLGLGINLEELNKEIEEIEKEMADEGEAEPDKKKKKGKLKGLRDRMGKDMNYIG